MATRVIAGAAMIAAAVACLWFGGTAFWAITAIAATLMFIEWAGLAGIRRAWIATTLFALALLYACPPFGEIDRNTVAILVIVAMLVGLGGGGGRLAGGVLYAGLPAICLLFLREQPQGIGLTLWTLAAVWATDIGAFFAGRGIGGPRLAPAISPNKTWAGLAGGIVAAAIFGALLAYMLELPVMLALLGGPMAVLAQLGDLYESWLKRRAGVKDSGSLLPGHGGVLDRLDGLVPVAVVVGTLRAVGAL